MFAIGSILACLWTWLRAKFPSSSILAQNYGGARGLQHRIIGTTLPIVMWLLIGFALFLLLIYLG